ncbi:MAG: acyl-CoA dehydrogenase family protein [Actinomycetota bacterium]
MDFDFSAEQYTLRDEARRFLAEQCASSHVREHLDDPAAWSRDVWKRMADLGWMALAFPESYGGLGNGFLDLVLLLGELGRAVAPVPFLSSVVCAGHTILAHGSDDQRARFLPGIASGERVGALAAPDPSYEVPHVVATPDGSGFRLDGEIRHVPDAPAADLFVVASGDRYFVVQDGFAVTVRRGIDPTRTIGSVTFHQAPAEALATPGLEPGYLFAVAGLTAEMIGTAERVLDETVAYTKLREQFGRPIGSFQAIKHRCAEMATDLEAARAAAYYACWAVASGAEDAAMAASVAKSFCGEALARVGGEGVQVHGGIAFTWEHDMHLFLKRLKSAEALLGDTAYHRERVARAAGL